MHPTFSLIFSPVVLGRHPSLGREETCFLHIVATAAQQLDIRRGPGASTRTRNNMVELKIRSAPTVAANTAIAFPNEQPRVLGNARVITIAMRTKLIFPLC